MKDTELFNNIQDIYKILENHRVTIKNCLDRTVIAQSKSSSANTRSNDNTKQINDLILAMDRISTLMYNVQSNVYNIQSEVRELKKPFYLKIKEYLLCFLKKKSQKNG